MELWEILVPTEKRLPVGKNRYFSIRHHRVFDQYVRSLAGGLTILTPAKGQWISMEGELVAERMIPVRIATDQATMEIISKYVSKHYDQLAVFYYRVSNLCIIEHFDKNKTKSS